MLESMSSLQLWRKSFKEESHLKKLRHICWSWNNCDGNCLHCWADLWWLHLHHCWVPWDQNLFWRKGNATSWKQAQWFILWSPSLFFPWHWTWGMEDRRAGGAEGHVNPTKVAGQIATFDQAVQQVCWIKDSINILNQKCLQTPLICNSCDLDV